MRSTVVKMMFLAVFASGSSSFAASVFNRPNAARNGVDPSLMADYGRESGKFTPGLSLSLRALDYTPLELEAGYFIGKGVWLKLNSYKFYIKDRFFLHLVDIGVLYLPGGTKPFNNADETRNLDVMLSTGAEVRVWKNLTIGLTLSWYLPNPVTVIRNAIDKVNNAVNNQLNNSPDGIDQGKKSVDDAGQHVRDVYKSAFADWHAVTALRWYF